MDNEYDIHDINIIMSSSSNICIICRVLRDAGIAVTRKSV